MLWAAGSSSDFQLCMPTQDDQHHFVSVPSSLFSSSRVLDLAAGALHTLVLLESQDGQRSIAGCGDNARGQLGDLARTVQNALPLRLPELRMFKPTGVHATWQTSFIQMEAINSRESDQLLSFGSNDLGELGNASTAKETSEVSCVCLTEAWPYDTPFRLKKVSPSSRHMLALLASPQGDQCLVGWGAARKGELGKLLSVHFQYSVKLTLLQDPSEQSTMPDPFWSILPVLMLNRCNTHL